MSVLKFHSYDEAIERANATKFGLAAGVITKDCKEGPCSYHISVNHSELLFSDSGFEVCAAITSG
jgi:hypothetical protein